MANNKNKKYEEKTAIIENKKEIKKKIENNEEKQENKNNPNSTLKNFILNFKNNNLIDAQIYFENNNFVGYDDNIDGVIFGYKDNNSITAVEINKYLILNIYKDKDEILLYGINDLQQIPMGINQNLKENISLDIKDSYIQEEETMTIIEKTNNLLDIYTDKVNNCLDWCDKNDIELYERFNSNLFLRKGRQLIRKK